MATHHGLRHLAARSLPVAVFLGVGSGKQKLSASELADEEKAPHHNTPLLREAAPRSLIRFFHYSPNLQVAYDTRTRNPVYVLERLVVEPSNNHRRRRKRPRFFAEHSLPQHFQSTHAHYHGTSGYDRGHMAPAADFVGNNDYDKTFCWTNVAPQDRTLNRSHWAQLEAWTRRVAQHYGNNQTRDDNVVYQTFVVTGPLWLPAQQSPEHEGSYRFEYPALGKLPHLLSVPTHFFKIVAVVNVANHTVEKFQPQIHAFACFLVPNQAPTHRLTSLAEYTVCWTDLEAVTGLEFFPQWASQDWKHASDHLSVVEMQGEPQLLPTTVADRGPVDQLSHLCRHGRCEVGNKMATWWKQ